MSRLTPVAFIVTLTLCGAVASAVAQQEQLFPYTKKNGRATVEYKHEGVTLVANYDYSQRNHGKAWLLIDIAAASEHRLVLHRTDLRLETPDGRQVKVATQEALIADSAGVRSLVQNAKVLRHSLESYFTQRQIERLRFYSFPGVGIAFDEAIMDNDRVTTGELFFKSPEGRWQDGTYRLVLDHERAKAAVPIALQ